MNTRHPLAQLLAPWLNVSDPRLEPCLVQQLQLDSRHIQPGETFIAIQGHAIDGRQFIDKAIEQGANLVLAQACEVFPHGHLEFKGRIPVLFLDALPAILSELAGRVYGGHHNQVIAVTGTNGKTTISQLIAQWLEAAGQKTAVMGTTGNGFLSSLRATPNTTGNAVEVQATLRQLAEDGACYTAMEVSSHGLVQGRVKTVPFVAGVFSNLSRDHLDYHGTMEAYAEAKLSLFTEHDCQQAIINVDDPVGASWGRRLPRAIGVSLHTQPNTQQALWATSVHYAENGISLDFSGEWGEGHLDVPLIGEFNAGNVLLALATLLSLGIDKNILLETATQLRPVVGRMELFRSRGQAQVVVDYAHTPDALEKALQALRVHCRGKLWVIFGCGGDRDKGKRPMMASIAEQFADEVILTDDNPRSESPDDIIQDMLAGLTHQQAYVEHDRFKALAYALEHAIEDDIILLAGKGHEEYQILAHQTVHYSDRESARILLERFA
ncbi:UDP-N-acetylmuramoyl-L-alanyl-D-glutamate--2,6-diaminopimelate ligase [Vibrio cincinnatiensis]|uniref:UDP-N-acetylmuramoyl-L-alanyl-D-glutamate--2, 6-diaminopimelate ligase n=1 Tax=Vibrio cincinnatiensis TaxID=675 RepID=UPI001EE052D1|nr:UDP-N-acetylmuramoyl-L-alanyl-D-glutamate--2,6-diaminopimelate ligase [Vibrio cincinnatiensis]MCG3758303.1 UDP-N-acetylmuramoyl-L-alanyl-D-glutamate--2,6-diaminopimelate ligase [Vibrio cincinnatiensis]MCG3761600.1 UDP-N-acetylmuramoyl-L-alanyl-D-glutamate--2,6-diaminopimelate ligase [Vibrio cincinnatiensis]